MEAAYLATLLSKTSSTNTMNFSLPAVNAALGRSVGSDALDNLQSTNLTRDTGKNFLLSQILLQQQNQQQCRETSLNEALQKHLASSLLNQDQGSGILLDNNSGGVGLAALLQQRLQQQQHQNLQQNVQQNLQLENLKKQLSLAASPGSTLTQPPGGAPISLFSDRANHNGLDLQTLKLASLLQQQHQQQQQHAQSTASQVLARHQVQDSMMLLSPASCDPQVAKRKGRMGAFPQKLHQMLTDLEVEGRSDIAAFTPTGRAFTIYKPSEFSKTVMNKYFRMGRFSSFQRQLNLYDFSRISQGPDKGAYHHELFCKGRPVLSTMMKRTKIKGTKIGKHASEDEASSSSHVGV